MATKVISLNVNGLNDRLKRTALIDWLKVMKVDVVCLQETHAASHSTMQGWFRHSGFLVASSSLSNKRCGAAVLVRDCHKLKQVRRDDVGRFVQAEIVLADQTLSFVSLYAPNKNPERNRFLASLPELIDFKHPIFVCGDFNTVLDESHDRKRRASYVGSSAARAQESGPALHSLLAATHTFPVWRTRHPTAMAYSWTHRSGAYASRIDMVWAPTCLEQQIRVCEYYPSFFSDHQYLLVEFTLDEIFVRGPGVWKFNTSLLDDEEYRTLVRSFWSFWKTQEGLDHFSTCLDWWDQGKYYLREVTRSYSKAKALQQRRRKSELERQMTRLQRLFDRGDSSAFALLCEVQEELRAIHLHEARGAQTRSRCRWAEEGEASTSFFFGLESKHRAKQTMTAIRDPESGVVEHDPIAILDVWRRYYDGLFTAQACDPAEQDSLLGRVTLSLSEAESESCEGHLSADECYTALQGMARGKTPGSDGFPMEFYLAFWRVLGADLVRVLNLAYEAGTLSVSQRRGLIVVLYKKNDRLETKNWRPISLLNVDYKIATRALSGRLLAVLPSIVGSDQTCGVRGRTISENLVLVRDLIEYAEREDLPLALLSLDQEKAFDRVDWPFMLRILERYNFGSSFRRWIQLIYSGVESAVVVNGWTSSFFRPSRGVRQGCPLSPLLYVLCIEILAVSIRGSPDVTGVSLPGSQEEFKCSGYADDTTIAVTTEASFPAVFELYTRYEQASGARLNRSKSQGIWLGAWKARTATPFGISWVKELPLLGAVFSAADYSEATWTKPVAKLEQRLAAWRGRRLTFQGKATIINVLALSQIWHLCHVFPIPEWAEKRITRAVWSFFWSGKRDLVARSTVCLPKSQGGFGVVHLSHKAAAFCLQWVKRFFSDDSRGKWKEFFHHFLSSCLRKEPFEAFSSSSTRTRLSSLPPFYRFLLASWRLLDGGEAGGQLALAASGEKPAPITNITSKSAYVLVRNLTFREPHCVQKFRPQYGPLHWPQTWQQIHLTTLDRVVVDLNWQIAHGVLYTGARLSTRFGMRNVDAACFCGAGDETLEHLFFECTVARLLVGWVYAQLLRVDPLARAFSVDELLFGFSQDRYRRIPVVFVWMLQVMKHAIWVARCDFRFRAKMPVESVCLKKGIARTKFVLELEARKCKLPAHFRSFERDWLAKGTLGHFEDEELVFSF